MTWDRTHTHTYTHVYTCTHMYTCMYTYVHTCIHTNTRVHTQKATWHKERVTHHGTMPRSSNIHLIGGLERESKHNGEEEIIRHLREC